MNISNTITEYINISLLAGLLLVSQSSHSQSSFTDEGVKWFEKLKTCTPYTWNYANPFAQDADTTQIIRGMDNGECVVDYFLPGTDQIFHCLFTSESIAIMTSDEEIEALRQGKLSGSTDSPQSRALNTDCTYINQDQLTGSVTTSDSTSKTPNTEIKAENIPTVVLFDRSVSMTDELDGIPKIEPARELLQRWIRNLDGRQDVGLQFFAIGMSETDNEANCRSSSIVVKLGKSLRVDNTLKTMGEMNPIGRKTNIAHALRQAQDQFSPDSQGRIVLISDGLENCEGDPIRQAKRLRDLNIKIDVIGIGKPSDIGALGRIALASGGEFKIADSPVALSRQMSNTLPCFTMPAVNADLDFPASEGGSVTEIIDVSGSSSASNSPVSQPAPAIEPLVLESTEVSDKGPSHIAIELIVDVSGSMAAWLGNETKMQIARRALAETLRGLKDPIFKVGLRAYGFDSSLPKTKEGSCPNTELLTEIKNSNLNKINSQVSNLLPYGYTPIADSLLNAGEDLTAVEAESRMIILITDGEETCDGDPIATARKLCQMGINLETHIIGFDLEPEPAQVLRDAAEAGCGTYVDAKNAQQLVTGLNTIVEAAQNKIDLTWLRTIHPVMGGANYTDPVELLPGTYTFDRWLEKDEQRYFKVNTTVGQHVLIRGLIQSKRLVRKEGELAESDSGLAQFRITLYHPEYDPLDSRAKTKTRFKRLSGEPGTYRAIGQQDIIGKGVIFSIGSPYDRVHADSLFNVEIRESGDVFENYDAPETYGELSLTLLLDQTVVGHLGEGDWKDLLVIPELQSPHLLTVVLGNPEFDGRLELTTPEGKRLYRERFRSEMQVLLEPGPARNLILESRNAQLRQKFTDYEITLRPQ